MPTTGDLPPRAAQLIALLGLLPHPEGGHYREIFRSSLSLQPGDDRAPRSAMTSIDFLLARGHFSAWHRVASDEAWHLLEGGPLRLWLAPPDLSDFHNVDLAPAADGCNAAGKAAADGGMRPRHVVPAGWWQAAEPLGDFAYVAATVAPGFDFADFTFGRDDAALRAALGEREPQLRRLL